MTVTLKDIHWVNTGGLTVDRIIDNEQTLADAINAGDVSIAELLAFVNQYFGFGSCSSKDPVGVDETPPKVVSISPANGSDNVLPTSEIQVTFSEPIEPTTVTSQTFFVSSAPSTTYCDGSVARCSPDSRLGLGETYTVTITTGVTDLLGNHLASEFTSTFVTAVPGATTSIDADMNGTVVLSPPGTMSRS